VTELVKHRISRTLIKLAPVGLLVVSTATAIILAEVIARFAVNPADFLHATPVEDEILGGRIPPLTTGHDALGFRNRTVPAQADVIAIGDSVTYGVSAPREASWPQRLGELLGERVYNMGLGGFGPLQYLHLAQSTAPPLRPRLLIVGFYFGNDLMDAYYVAHGRPHWHRWRVSSTAPSGATDFDRAGKVEPKKRLSALRNWLSRNSVLYSMLRETLLRPFAAREQDAMARGSSPDVRLLWNDVTNPAVRTIFTPQYRLAAVDLTIHAVQEGMQISQNAFMALRAEADRQAVQLLVVLIPTKERAYCRHLRETGAKMPGSYVKLCEAETLANAELARFLVDRGIAHIDVTPAFELQIDRHIQIYPTDSDGHPQAAGYEVIAREVASAVTRHFPRK
jgi:lysophospholipase L1-like esterase